MKRKYIKVRIRDEYLDYYPDVGVDLQYANRWLAEVERGYANLVHPMGRVITQVPGTHIERLQ
jgi:L-ribulose-5-phosphate 3-epimerase UlaE